MEVEHTFAMSYIDIVIPFFSVVWYNIHVPPNRHDIVNEWINEYRIEVD